MRVATSLIALTTMLAAIPATARAATDAEQAGNAADQNAGGESLSGIGDIVVTAQKRAENVQTVPIAISAFTAGALAERAVTDVSSLSNLTPNVTLDAGAPFSGSTSVLAAYIRGIGQNEFAANFDPGVGVYLDGVYLARTIGANLNLPDVERVEILKGPQGTLFGRNTVGGAISVVTRDPDNEVAFRGSVTTGRFNRLDLAGSVDLPISDNLGAMVTFASNKRQGYQKVVPFPGGAGVVDPLQYYRLGLFQTSDRNGGTDDWVLRGKLKWDNGDVRVVLAGDYSRVDQPSSANSLLATTEFLPGPFAGLAANNIPGTAFDPSGTTGFLFAGLYNFCIGSTPTEIAARNAQNLCGPRNTPVTPDRIRPGLGSVNVDGTPTNDRLPYDSRFISPDKDETYGNGLSYSRITSYGAMGTIDFELADNAALKSITGYRKLKFNAGIDLDASPITLFEISNSLKQWQFSQELQLTGSMLDDALHYAVGAYFFKEKSEGFDALPFGSGLLSIEGLNRLSTTNYAAFGQIDWRVSDLIGITLGGRYTHEKKSFEGFQSDINGFNYKLFNCTIYGEPCQSALGFPDPNNPLRYFVPGVQHQKFNNFSPKIGVQLHPVDQVMLYGSWSKGYKTGGWTTRLSNPLDFAPSFTEEKATTWEAGFKSRLFGRQLQLNGAVFTTKYQDIQLNFQLGISPTIQNAGNARIKGFELEAVAAPLDGLTITGSLGYVDAKYTSVLPQAAIAPNPFQAGVFVGATLPKTPKWKLNVSPRYEFDLGSSGSIILIGDYTYTSKIWNDTERTFLLMRPRTDLVSASITYRAPDEKWDVTIGGTNLTNERFINTGQAQIAGGQIYGTWSRPAEWYAKLAVKF
jgi:outer membrane receptor protein involved in Fe transport